MLTTSAIRAHFPAFDNDAQPRFFENAGGSFPCRQTVDAITDFYTRTKVQPYAGYAQSAELGHAMDRSYRRWEQALGLEAGEVTLGPSTSMNTYVLAHALSNVVGPGDEVIVTNQDHEANTGATRRMAEAVGATIREWRVDPGTGLLSIDDLSALISPATKLLTMPHCSNIIGMENDVTAACSLMREAGALSVIDGVSFAPHGFPDVAALGADIYLFSLYKTYSVHQGLMTVRKHVSELLPNQGHYFNSANPHKRLSPAGPDHVQVAAAGAVLDYVEATHGTADGSLRSACAAAAQAWQDHESELLRPVLDWLGSRSDVRLVGPAETSGELHRCPTVAFVPAGDSPAAVAQRLVDRGIMASAGDFYAHRVLEGVGIDPNDGVVRLSWVHYTSTADIEHLLDALDASLSS